ncbi:hypothetical protein ACFIOY_27940 [Bradyrhizobium sp. TZ2]
MVGGWIWAPQISSLMPGFSSGISSAGSGGSWFADANRLGRPEVAPVVRSCIFRVLDLDRRDVQMEPSAGYFILKAGSMQASVSTLVGKPDARSENHTVVLASTWGELATCIYAQDDRELCDPDNRAAMVEATTKFFAFAKQTEASKPPISAGAARVIENISDRLLNALKNHRRYGTLVAADFSSFAPPEIMRIMREETQTRDICKR